MKNKFTLLIMFFINVAILVAFALLGLIIWDKMNPNINTSYSEVFEVSDENDNFNIDDEEIIKKINNEIEAPKTVNTSNRLNSLKDVDTEEVQEEEANYNNTSVNKYFYNQLNTYSKIIYKKFEENKENMKSGTYKLKFGNEFSDILLKENGQDELGSYYQSAIEAYTYDNPDVFYLSPGKMYLNIETTTRGTEKTFNCYISAGEGSDYLIDQFYTKEEINNAIGKIENVRDKILERKTGNTYKDIKLIHDYLVYNLDYDTSTSGEHIYDIYGALINHKCVCEGYAKAFKYLLDSFGIESTIVIGTATNSQGQSENHAWNYVNLDGIWYGVDCTWDDPIIIGGFDDTKISYTYFLKGSNTFDVDHFPTGFFTEEGKEFIYPTISVRDY